MQKMFTISLDIYHNIKICFYEIPSNFFCLRNTFIKTPFNSEERYFGSCKLQT